MNHEHIKRITNQRTNRRTSRTLRRERILQSKLWLWVREYAIAQDYIQRAVAEGLADTRNFNLYETIKTAQYLFYSDEVYADYATLEQLHKLHRELAEIEREQAA